ncbi:hypothetical protein O6H91_06G027500 [Diphasiastrum complanatum]|uniref:Uncharacterized protein n=1 Tax=Diphasiastrum complanatum TaxID=34168 RepID=A0ACC2DBZ9_DIPCM|nr:hypothetical protein O6H91_06G027500 [Diphasiastrum complanatum]
MLLIMDLDGDMVQRGRIPSFQGKISSIGLRLFRMERKLCLVSLFLSLTFQSTATLMKAVALSSGVAQISDNDSELDQASTVVTSSSIGSKLHSGSGNSGCCSPSDVFASFSDDSEDPGSPLFDPDLLNAFERALADVDKDCLKTSENVSCDAASVSPSQVSLKPKNHEVDPKDNSENLRGGARSSRLKISIGASEGILGDCRDKKDFENARKILEGLLGSSRGRKSTACKEFFPSESANPLNTFMSLCPSDGDQKVVLFLTSLRGIRKTYEDCNNVRMLLRSSSVRIDERDVSMHSEYKRELRELLGVSVSLPRLFIKGKYIGGVEEIMRLHEDGVLEKLLEDLPKVTSFRACEACGEMRFVPCTECSGSRKIITDDNEVERCPECNENGLVRCLICC